MSIRDPLLTRPETEHHEQEFQPSIDPLTSSNRNTLTAAKARCTTAPFQLIYAQHCKYFVAGAAIVFPHLAID
jgi:hypothetical protein